MLIRRNQREFALAPLAVGLVLGNASLPQPEFDAFVTTLEFMSEDCFSASATCDGL